jgi:hypothetical protein
MRLPHLAIAICSVVSLSFLPAAAQTLPDYLVHRVPTAPDPGPLAFDKTLADYIIEGYAVVLKTRLSGRFTGCRRLKEIEFDDHSRFRCNQDITRAEETPEVKLLRNGDDGSYVLFIGKHTYVGSLLAKRGVKLNQYLHLGDRLVGIPRRIPDERRAMGYVDPTNGKIPVVGINRSIYAGSVPELSTWPSNLPPNHTSLNPAFRDTYRKGSVADAPPQQ